MKIPFKKNQPLIWLFACIVILIALNIFQKEVKGFFYWFSAPVQKTLWSAGNKTSDFFEGILKISSLKNELDILRQQSQSFIIQSIKLNEIEKENKALREALNLNLKENLSLAVALIISKSPTEDIVYINKGFEDGIAEGMPVVTQEKVLAGKISQVYKKYSAVSLASEKDICFDAKIYREEKEIPVIARGEGNLNILLELIPREEEIKEDDIVFTISLGGNFPDSLLVGKIKKVIKKDTEPFQTAKIEPAFNLSETEYLFIITNF